MSGGRKSECKSRGRGEEGESGEWSRRVETISTASMERMTVDTRVRVKRNGTRGGQVQVSLRSMWQDRRRLEFGEERAEAIAGGRREAGVWRRGET